MKMEIFAKVEIRHYKGYVKVERYQDLMNLVMKLDAIQNEKTGVVFKDDFLEQYENWYKERPVTTHVELIDMIDGTDKDENVLYGKTKEDLFIKLDGYKGLLGLTVSKLEYQASDSSAEPVNRIKAYAEETFGKSTDDLTEKEAENVFSYYYEKIYIGSWKMPVEPVEFLDAETFAKEAEETYRLKGLIYQ